jgi:pimeloyl-ACP methyl ester carboxylesterase
VQQLEQQLAAQARRGDALEQRLDEGAAARYLGAAVARDFDPAAAPPLRLPLRVLHGVDDARVPLAVSRLPGDARCRRELPGVGHFELIDPTSRVFADVLAALDEIAEELAAAAAVGEEG